jgi:competence protein ComEC
MIFEKPKTNYFILITLLIAASWIWLVLFNQVSDNILEVIFFDIGQGDSIFIETPSGRQVLIDGSNIRQYRD